MGQFSRRWLRDFSFSVERVPAGMIDVRNDVEKPYRWCYGRSPITLIASDKQGGRMNRNAIIVALIVGFGVYVWKDGEDQAEPQPAAMTGTATTSQDDAEAAQLLEEARRERERIEQLKEDMEVDRLNAELDRRIDEQQQREQLARSQEQARKERQQRKWKQNFNDRADRREAWQDYNASKDAVSEVTDGDHWNLSPPAYSEELPKQQLRRRYGDSATLEQNELD